MFYTHSKDEDKNACMKAKTTNASPLTNSCHFESPVCFKMSVLHVCASQTELYLPIPGTYLVTNIPLLNSSHISQMSNKFNIDP